MIKGFKERDVPVGGIGIQAHIYNMPDEDQYKASTGILASVKRIL